MRTISLTERQKKIAEMVREQGPITGANIAQNLNVTRAALRSDLAILVMSGVLDARPKVGYFYTGKNNLSMLTDELANLCVRDIQSVPVVLQNTKNAYDAIVTMFLEDVGSVFILDEKSYLCGVVSRKDLLKAALNNKDDLSKTPIIMVMTPLSKLIVTTAEEPIAVAIRKIIDNEIDGLPVVKQVGKEKKYEIVGRLTKTNLGRLLLDLAEGRGRFLS